MHPFPALLWKEWHEQKWRLAALTAMVATIVAFVWWREPEVAMATTWVVLAGHATFGAIFVGMGVVAGERRDGTERTLLALPTRPAKAMSAKLVWAVVACLMPVAVGGAIAAAAIAVVRSSDIELYRRVMVNSEGSGAGAAVFACSGLAISMLLWTTALGARAGNELLAGLWGAAAGAAWFALGSVASLLDTWLVGSGPSYFGLTHATVMLSPVGLLVAVADLPGAVPAPLIILLQLSLWTALVAATLVRARASAATSAMVVEFSRSPRPLRPPHRSPALALAWLQWRQTRVVLVLGLLVIVAVAAFESPRWVSRPGGNAEVTIVAGRAASAMRDAAFGWGMLIAVLVGVAGFTPDLAPKLAHFWRSRPIRIGGWFWSKWLSGLIALLVIVHGSVLLAAVTLGRHEIPLGPGYFAVVPLLHVAAFATAAATACAIRQPVYAAILGTGLAFVPLIVLETEPRLDWMRVSRVLNDSSGREFIGATDPAYLALAALLLAIAAVATGWARWAAQR